MAAKYFAILTNLGAAKLANATALGTQLEITHMAVGDGGGGLPIPNPAQTALIGERRRAAINLLTIDPLNNSQIISEQVIPEDVGGWWIREVGLFDKDGSLVAIANCPETYKPQLQEGSGRTQTIRVILIVSSTQSVSLKIDPSVVLATRQYVDDKVIEVRAYVNKVLEDHINADDPHEQYAKALEVLKKDANGEDINNKAKFRENLGIKSAGLKEIGSGIGQVPDMSYFASIFSGSSACWKRPDGIIEQSFIVTFPITVSQGGVIEGTQLVNYLTPFPEMVLGYSCTKVDSANTMMEGAWVSSVGLKSLIVYGALSTAGSPTVGQNITACVRVWGK